MSATKIGCFSLSNIKYAFFVALIVCIPLFSAKGSGIVIYRQQAFHSDAQAILKPYKSCTVIPQLVTVFTESGQRIDIKSGQFPIVIPAPSEEGVDKAKIIPAIDAAIQRFPQLRPKLEEIKIAWGKALASPTPPVAAIASATATPIPDKAKAPTFKTRNGIEYKGFSVVKIEPNGITINYDEGLARIGFFDLTDEQIKEYGLNQQAAEELTKQQKETQYALAVKQQQASEERRQRKDLEELETKNGFESQGTVFQVVPGNGILYKGYRIEEFIANEEREDGSLSRVCPAGGNEDRQRDRG